MDDKWKDALKNLSVSLDKLDEKQQCYIVGFAEGMVFAKESQQNEPLAAAT